MNETFSYIAPYMGEFVVITLKTPDTARINRFFAEQRKITRGSDEAEKKDERVDAHRRSFFDEMFQSAEASRGDKKEPFPSEQVMDAWKEHCIASAFELLGRLKN